MNKFSGKEQNHTFYNTHIKIFLQLIYNLNVAETNFVTELTGQFYEESNPVEVKKRNNNISLEFTYNLCKGILFLYFEKPTQAWSFFSKANKSIDASESSVISFLPILLKSITAYELLKRDIYKGSEKYQLYKEYKKINRLIMRSRWFNGGFLDSEKMLVRGLEWYLRKNKVKACEFIEASVGVAEEGHKLWLGYLGQRFLTRIYIREEDYENAFLQLTEATSLAKKWGATTLVDYLQKANAGIGFGSNISERDLVSSPSQFSSNSYSSNKASSILLTAETRSRK